MNLKPNDQQFMIRIYETYKGFLFHAARKFTSSQSDCEDIIQDTIVRLMRNIATLRQLSENQTATYLYLTVRSVYADRMKSAHERMTVVCDETQELADDSARLDFDAKWDAQILRSELSPRDWSLLEYKYILGYSDEEIARAVDCAPDSVRTMLRRARGRARAVLTNGEEGNG